jgi:cupin superfamily acireductone dioxygenase involved in methionine salvage
MEIIKIKLHSSVDLITNSSTVIFTYSEGSLSAVKDLVNEMLKVFGREETFDDIFYAEVFLQDDSDYYENDLSPEELTLDDWKETQKVFEALKLSVLKKEIEKPNWMEKIEDEENFDGYNSSTSLNLMAKDEKYSELANKLLKYLYSTSHEATRDG